MAGDQNPCSTILHYHYEDVSSILTSDCLLINLKCQCWNSTCKSSIKLKTIQLSFIHWIEKTFQIQNKQCNTYSNFQGNPSELKTDNKTFSIWLYIIKESFGWNKLDCSISLACSWKLNIIIQTIVSEGNQMRAFWWIPKQIFIPTSLKMKMYAMSTQQKKSCSMTSPQFIQKHLFVFFSF